MRRREIERMAAQNEKPAFYMTPPEIYLYNSFNYLYKKYRSGYISKSDAKTEKQDILNGYAEYMEYYSEWRAVYAQFQEGIRLCSQLMTSIEKSDNVHEIALFACEALSILTGDKNFVKRQRRKL